MSFSVFPTKGNLIHIKKSLMLAKLGFDLMDRKRNVLVREMMALIDSAKSIRGEIESTFARAYKALQTANITLGVCDSIAKGIEVETGLEIKYKSVMGVEIPKVRLNSKNVNIPKFEKTIKYISDALEEKEREEFGRLKVIKKTKQK